MRYYFILLSICAVWIVGVVIARLGLNTHDTFLLYLLLMFFTVSSYLIGFTSGKQ